MLALSLGENDCVQKLISLISLRMCVQYVTQVLKQGGLGQLLWYTTGIYWNK